MTAATLVAPRAPSRAAASLALPALALLGLALASPVRASPVDTAWSVVSGRGDALVQCADDSCVHVEVDLGLCEREAAGNACGLLRSLGGWCDDGDCSVGDPTLDRDHDLVPDSVEEAACGRAAVRHVADAQAGTQATRCRSASDMGGLPDADRDGIPDSFEPGLCAVEDSNTGLDGSCDGTGTDYRI